MVIFFCGVSFWYVNKQVFRRKYLFQKLTIFVEVKPPIWSNGSKISEKMRGERLDIDVGGGVGFVR